MSVLSPSKILGMHMIGGHGVGGDCSHIKAFGLSHSDINLKGNSVLKACWTDMP